MFGWVCPKCQRVYSPDTKECDPCNAFKVTPTDPFPAIPPGWSPGLPYSPPNWPGIPDPPAFPPTYPIITCEDDCGIGTPNLGRRDT